MSTQATQGQGKLRSMCQKAEQGRERRTSKATKSSAPPNPLPGPLYDGTTSQRQSWFYTTQKLEGILNNLFGPGNTFDKDRCRWLFSTITILSTQDKRIRHEGQFISLHHEVLRTVIGQRHHTRIISAMLSAAVIERNGSWRAGHYSQGYRLTRPFRAVSVTRMRIQDVLMNKKLNQHREKQRAKFSLQPAYAAVYDTVEALTLDGGSARRWIELTYPPEDPANTYRYLSRIIGVDAITYGNSFHIVDHRTGRYFHSLACISKDIRPRLRWHGMPLHEVDIANAQPLLLHLLLRSDPSIPLEERLRMEQIVLDGQFYETLNASGMERDAFKEAFFEKVLFGKVYRNRLMEVFEQIFPTYAQTIRRTKQGDYRRLAISLQALEASIVFDAVDRFRKKAPNAPIATIHDSLLTTAPFVHVVRECLAEAFWDRYAIRPHLKTKAAQ